MVLQLTVSQFLYFNVVPYMGVDAETQQNRLDEFPKITVLEAKPKLIIAGGKCLQPSNRFQKWLM